MWYASTNKIGMEINWMDINMKIFIWNMMGDDKYDRDGLEHNGSECIARWQYFMKPDGIWQIILRKKNLNIFQREGINMECDKSQWIWSGCKQTECIEMCQYDMLWDGNGIDFFNANYQRYLSRIGSVGNCLPRAWRGHWRTGRLTRRCSCTVICRICITELLINTIVFFYDNNSRYEVMG